MSKRIYLHTLRAYSPDREREIEMAVDAAVRKQELSVQFWKDVQTYGLYEALLYLRGYMVQGLARSKETEAVAKLVDTVIGECTDPVDPSNGEPCFPHNPQPEGNGFDNIDTATPLTEDEK